MQGALILEAFEGLRAGDVKEIVGNLVKRAKTENAAAQIVLKLLVGQGGAAAKGNGSREPSDGRLPPPPGVHPDDDDSPPAKIARLTNERACLPAIRRIVKAVGPECTVAHVLEDGIVCSQEAFQVVKDAIFPPKKAWWKEPVGAGAGGDEGNDD